MVKKEEIINETKDKFVEDLKRKIRFKSLKFFSAGRYVPGISNATEMDLVTKYVIFNVFVIVGFFMFVPFTINEAASPETDMSVVLTYSALCCFVFFLFVLARTKVSFYLPATLLVFTYLGFVCYVLIGHPSGGHSAALWSFILPPLAFYVLGNIGLIPCSIAAVVMIYAFNASVDFYPYEFALRSSVIYAFTVAFASISYKRTQVLTLSLMRSREQLQNELTEIEVMKDNLQAGVFLLDSAYLIQPLYSKGLIQILGKEKLDYSDFISILHFSLKQKELTLLKDYLEMVFLGVHDVETLQDVNPLQKFKYITESKVEKIVSINFTLIQKKGDEKAILAVARDITYESELEEKLVKEEQFRQQEMKAMFEVMQVSPQNLNDFLDELEFEFVRMNTSLKDKTRSQKEIYTDLFQGIHAMKSNALVIGLDSAAARFHEFEDKLAVLIDSSTMSYEELLEIVFELERVMDIVDNLKGVVKKMEDFSDSTKQVQGSSDILLQSIRNTVNKAKAETGKGAIVKATNLDWGRIDTEYRRVLKEVIMQFTRNAMIHGFEDGAVRLAQGKALDGVITLSIVIAHNKIEVEFSDDGAGIDFEKVKTQAIEKNLYSEKDNKLNKDSLVKALFSPGFSTADELSLHAGRGVGLSLVSDRIKEYKGSIKVKSVPKQGTKFIVELPYKYVS